MCVASTAVDICANGGRGNLSEPTRLRSLSREVTATGHSTAAFWISTCLDGCLVEAAAITLACESMVRC